MLTKKQKKEFFSRLEGPDGCDFREDASGKFIWNCKGDRCKDLSFKILKDMKISGENIAKFLEDCERTGGYCDCEIIFNSKEALLKEVNENES